MNYQRLYLELCVKHVELIKDLSRVQESLKETKDKYWDSYTEAFMTLEEEQNKHINK